MKINKINRSSYFLLFLIVLLLNTSSQAQTAPNHGLWHQVLKKHVSTDGKVDYVGIKNDLNFKKYLHIATYKRNIPNDNWSREDKLAYWINMYNAFTVKLIIDNYPVNSIKDIGTTTKDCWDIKFIKIGSEMYSLRQIEDDILRKEFNDPRIHFAIVCASISCPNLRNEAFFPDKIEVQLKDQAYQFINNPSKNTIALDKSALSPIFDWFKKDFTGEMKLYKFINQYSKVKITKKTKLTYTPYDWGLNKQD